MRIACIASGVFIVLLLCSAALMGAFESSSLGIFAALLMGLVYAIPIVIIATAYERRPLYSLKPGRRWGDETNSSLR